MRWFAWVHWTEVRVSKRLSSVKLCAWLDIAQVQSVDTKLGKNSLKFCINKVLSEICIGRRAEVDLRKFSKCSCRGMAKSFIKMGDPTSRYKKTTKLWSDWARKNFLSVTHWFVIISVTSKVTYYCNLISQSFSGFKGCWISAIQS